MRTFLKFTQVLAVVFTAMGVHATNADFYLHVKKEQGKSISFTLNQVKQLNLSIIDSNGDFIFTENVSSATIFNRTYNLTEFPRGTYYLEIETDVKVVRYEINVFDNQAFLSKEALKETAKPILKSVEGFVSLQIENPEKTPIKVSICDSSDEEVYSGIFEEVATLNKKFDLTKSQGEHYTFVMTYNNKFFVENIVTK